MYKSFKELMKNLTALYIIILKYQALDCFKILHTKLWKLNNTITLEFPYQQYSGFCKIGILNYNSHMGN